MLMLMPPFGATYIVACLPLPTYLPGRPHRRAAPPARRQAGRPHLARVGRRRTGGASGPVVRVGVRVGVGLGVRVRVGVRARVRARARVRVRARARARARVGVRARARVRVRVRPSLVEHRQHVKRLAARLAAGAPLRRCLCRRRSHGATLRREPPLRQVGHGPLSASAAERGRE